MYLANQTAQFRTFLDKVINFFDLGQDMGGLFANCFGKWTTTARKAARLLICLRRKDRPNGRWEYAAAAWSAKQFSCCSVAESPSDFVRVGQANRDINRDNIETWSIVVNIGQAERFSEWKIGPHPRSQRTNRLGYYQRQRQES